MNNGKRTKEFEYKIASDEQEFEQIYKLNYQTFSIEIPQHRKNNNARLIDSFHAQNTYVICKSGNQLVGMLALRAARPFSLDKKLENLDNYLPEAKNIVEIRLLAVDVQYRYSAITAGLIAFTIEMVQTFKYDLVVMSGIINQQKLYTRLGFKPFGPVVGTGKVIFQPMYMNKFILNNICIPRISKISPTSYSRRHNFLPGPVEIPAHVLKAVSHVAISHRDHQFSLQLQNVKSHLCQLVKTKSVEIMTGGGTFANDVIAAQLVKLGGKGLILSNGEFGDRLIDHAKRFSLDFNTLKQEWNKPFKFSELRTMLSILKPEWIWFTHCETSSGIINDIGKIASISKKYNSRLVIDIVSSIGNIDLSLEDIYLASASSGKGLGSISGLAMIFYNHELEENIKIPRSLDLYYYANCNIVPYTLSSNVLYALESAISKRKFGFHHDFIRTRSNWLKKQLKILGYQIVAEKQYTNPAVITINLPSYIESLKFGDHFKKNNIFISYKSNYLIDRNWVQVCLMGDASYFSFGPLIAILKKYQPAQIKPSTYKKLTSRLPIVISQRNRFS